MNASTPRILQSADEAPCGSLLRFRSKSPHVTVRMPCGTGWTLVGYRPGKGSAWEWSYACRGAYDILAEGLTEAECRHLSGLSAADAIAWCEERQAALQVAETCKGNAESLAGAKPRPQPGDVVSWDEVEDGALYFDPLDICFFAACRITGDMWLIGPNDRDLLYVLREEGYGAQHGTLPSARGKAVLVARDLGSNPEAWRKARREWTAHGNKPRPEFVTVGRDGFNITPLAAAVADIDATAEVGESAAWAKVKAATVDINAYMHNVHRALMVAEDERNTALEMADHRLNELRKAEIALSAADRAKRVADAVAEQAIKERDAANGQRDIEVAHTEAARKERDEARAGWAEQSADAARLRLALEKAQQQIVQAHEDIDVLIAKQTAADFEIAALKQDRAWAQEGRELERVLAAGSALLAQHHARIVGRLLDEMARGYFVDRFLDPNLYADAMKAAGREVKS